ncbi:hypothetical protein PCI56_21550 [Plesiomonas shigelloides subsp. oncorhynchi]|nr:hypothetical protein [Plesiomonas shigelloides]
MGTVFTVGQKGDLTGLCIIQCSNTGDDGIAISVYFSTQMFSQIRETES